MVDQLVIRAAVIDDAEELGVAHVVAADEAYGHYFPAEFMTRNTVERRSEMWRETLSTSEGKPRVLLAESGGQPPRHRVLLQARVPTRRRRRTPETDRKPSQDPYGAALVGSLPAGEHRVFV